MFFNLLIVVLNDLLVIRLFVLRLVILSFFVEVEILHASNHLVVLGASLLDLLVFLLFLSSLLVIFILLNCLLIIANLEPLVALEVVFFVASMRHYDLLALALMLLITLNRLSIHVNVFRKGSRLGSQARHRFLNLLVVRAHSPIVGSILLFNLIFMLRCLSCCFFGLCGLLVFLNLIVMVALSRSCFCIVLVVHGGVLLRVQDGLCLKVSVSDRLLIVHLIILFGYLFDRFLNDILLIFLMSLFRIKLFLLLNSFLFLVVLIGLIFPSLDLLLDLIDEVDVAPVSISVLEFLISLLNDCLFRLLRLFLLNDSCSPRSLTTSRALTRCGLLGSSWWSSILLARSSRSP